MAKEKKVARKNPLLEKVQIPGEKFRLPSGGLFYEDDELDSSVENGEVFVNPMNAIDELNMKSPDKLLSGESVIEIIERCIPDVKNPKQLLAKDVDYLLMCLRMVSYGPDVNLTATHDCKNAKEHSYAVPIRPILQATKPIDPTSLKKYQLTLGNDQVVKLNPPRYMSTIKLYQLFGLEENEVEFDPEKMGAQLLDNIADMIKSVDDHENRKDIVEWLKAIRIGDVESISEKITDLSDWGLDHVIDVKCRDCKKELNLQVPINPIAFFI